ncbi:hypothetical protein F441_16738, partial [Phytophthora nicotianae CJ01A1]
MALDGGIDQKLEETQKVRSQRGVVKATPDFRIATPLYQNYGTPFLSAFHFYQSLCHHSSTSHEAARKAVDTEEERPAAKQKQGQE